MLDRGKVTVLAILVLAAAAGGYAVWTRSGESPQAIELWGADTAKLLVNARQVEVRRVVSEPFQGTQKITDPAGKSVLAGPPRDLTSLRDLTYIRRALLNDDFFAWDQSPEGCEPRWAFVIAFRDQGQAATIWIDDECQIVQLAERPEALACMRPDLLNSIRRFLDRYAIGPEPTETAP
jgi:hypothetical protein